MMANQGARHRSQDWIRKGGTKQVPGSGFELYYQPPEPPLRECTNNISGPFGRLLLLSSKGQGSPEDGQNCCCQIKMTEETIRPNQRRLIALWLAGKIVKALEGPERG